MGLGERVFLFALFVFVALLGGFLEARREQKEFKKWLEEGRWKYEKWPPKRH